MKLSSAQSEALARLLCLLETGEGAAELSFTSLAGECTVPGARHALAQIALEEAEHGSWVETMAGALPPPSGARSVIQAARKMHYAIGQGSLAERLAGVTALDSAACILFSRLLRPAAPLASDSTFADGLRRIHRDEARHVAIASRFAMACGNPAVLQQRAVRVRREFAAVLALVSDDFEALAVDPDEMMGAVQTLPSGLFA